MTAATQVAAASAAWPDYFQSIQERATKRWDQLDADPELAGPRHRLFKQVQSPRHVLSELLQNANDTGASEAFVSIENARLRALRDGGELTIHPATYRLVYDLDE
jgi:hypothetical protein